jgi:hypothetical protein
LKLVAHQEGDADHPPARLAVAGVLESRGLDLARFEVPPRPLLAFLAFLAVGFLLTPLAKLWLLGPRDKLDSVDARLMAVTGLLLAGVVTIIVLDLFWLDREMRDTDEHLQELAGDIATNVTGVTDALDSWVVSQKGLIEKLPEKAGDETKECEGLENPYSDKRFVEGSSLTVLMDRQGNQRCKWAGPADRVTPKVWVGDRGYFTVFASRDEHDRIHLDTIRSRNTGSVLPFVSRAVVTTKSASDPSSDQTWVLGSLIRSKSLYDLEMGPGDGYALIQPDGQVQSHSTPLRNLSENFFEEVDGSEELKAAIDDGRIMWSSQRYHGVEHRMYLAPMMEFGNFTNRTPNSLVVFQGDARTDLKNAYILSTAGMCLFLFGLAALLLQGRALVRSEPLHLAWYWPARNRSAERIVAVVVLAAAAASGVWAGTDLALTKWGALAILIGVPVATLAAVVRRFEPESSEARWVRRVAALSLLVGLSAWFVGAVFARGAWVSIPSLMAVALLGLPELTGPMRGTRLESWASRLGPAASGHALMLLMLLVIWGCLPAAIFFRDAAAQEAGAHARLAWLPPSCPTARGVWDEASGTDLADSARARLGALTRGVRSFVPSNGRLAYRLRERLQVEDTPPVAAAGPQDCPVSAVVGGEPPVSPYRGLAALALLILPFVGFLMVRSVSKRILGREAVPPELPSASPRSDARLSLHVRSRLVGPAVVREPDPPPEPGRVGSDPFVLQRSPEGTPSAERWRASVPSVEDAPTVEIPDLEHRLSEPAWNRATLDLLEHLVLDPKRRVRLVSQIDPILFIDSLLQEAAAHTDRQEQKGEQEPGAAWRGIGDRWAHLLARFERSEECHLLEAGECAQGQAGYREIWGLCTTEEKVALLQIAEAGLINPALWAVVQRLEQRGLIVRDPAPRFTSAGLRGFVRNTASRESVETWVSEGGRSTWTALRAPIMGTLVILAILLLATQPDLADMSLGLLAGAAVGLPVILRIASLFQMPSTDRS